MDSARLEPPKSATPEPRAVADSLRATRSTPAPPTRRASPFSVMMRSALVPGWGQMYNHKPWKAALVVGGEGYLIYKAYGKYQDEQDAANAGDPIAKDKYYNEKVNYIWWALAVHLLQMADAYVDAHLSTFDVDFGPDQPEHAEGPALGPDSSFAEAAVSKPTLPGVRAALHVHF